MLFLMNMSLDMLGTLWKITTDPIYPLERVHKLSYFTILWDAHFEAPCLINVHVQNNNYRADVENKHFGVMVMMIYSHILSVRLINGTFEVTFSLLYIVSIQNIEPKQGHMIIVNIRWWICDQLVLVFFLTSRKKQLCKRKWQCSLDW
jgi:hypothetical protein